MQPAGLAAFAKRAAEKSAIYAHESEAFVLSKDFEKKIRQNKKAWAYFQSLAPSYKKLSVHWIMTAKQGPTKLKRLAQIITDSENNTNQWKDNKYKKKQ